MLFILVVPNFNFILVVPNFNFMQDRIVRWSLAVGRVTPALIGMSFMDGASSALCGLTLLAATDLLIDRALTDYGWSLAQMVEKVAKNEIELDHGITLEALPLTGPAARFWACLYNLSFKTAADNKAKSGGVWKAIAGGGLVQWNTREVHTSSELPPELEHERAAARETLANIQHSLGKPADVELDEDNSALIRMIYGAFALLVSRIAGAKGCSAAAFIIAEPRSVIRPISSHNGRNSSGEIRPRRGCRQRARASKPEILPSDRRTTGW